MRLLIRQPWARALPLAGFLDPAGQPVHHDTTDANGDGQAGGAGGTAGRGGTRILLRLTYGDFEGCGAAIAAFADSQARADAAADAMLVPRVFQNAG
jgi:hypothetical protein